ncbi:hypothetical protein Tco_0151464 [Tanacetum coccineum]
MPPPDPNNTYIQPPSEKQILKFIKTLDYDEDPKTKMIVVSKMVSTRLHQPWRAILSVLNRSLTTKDLSWDIVILPILQILWGIIHFVNLDFTSLIWDEFEWQTVERSSRPSKMSKLLYTHFTKLIINHFLSNNKSIPRRSTSKLHISQDDQPITKLSNSVKDHDALNAQDAEPSFHKRSHDNHNNREGGNKKKCRKDVGEPSSRSSRRNKSLVIYAQADTPVMKPLDQEDKYPERRKTLPLTKHYAAVLANKDGDRIDFFKAEMSTRTKGSIYSYLRIKSVVRVVVKKKWGYGFLTTIVVRKSDDKEYVFNYADLPRLSLNDVEDMYLLQVQDTLHHLPLEFVKDFNNALLLFIKRVVIQNRVEDIQLGVKSYQ